MKYISHTRDPCSIVALHELDGVRNDEIVLADISWLSHNSEITTNSRDMQQCHSGMPFAIIIHTVDPERSYLPVTQYDMLNMATPLNEASSMRYRTKVALLFHTYYSGFSSSCRGWHGWNYFCKDTIKLSLWPEYQIHEIYSGTNFLTCGF